MGQNLQTSQTMLLLNFDFRGVFTGDSTVPRANQEIRLEPQTEKDLSQCLLRNQQLDLNHQLNLLRKVQILYKKWIWTIV
jgi:hypothetical protein